MDHLRMRFAVHQAFCTWIILEHLFDVKREEKDGKGQPFGPPFLVSMPLFS